MKHKEEVELICGECGSTDEVAESTVWWTAWGRNCFDFNWAKHEGSKKLCHECECEEWKYCYSCGALIEADYACREHGIYIDETAGAYYCPDCSPFVIKEKRIERRLTKSLKCTASE